MEGWKIAGVEEDCRLSVPASAPHRTRAVIHPAFQPSNLPIFQSSSSFSFSSEFWWAFFLKAFETLTGIGGRCAKSPGQRFEHQRIGGVSVY